MSSLPIVIILEPSRNRLLRSLCSEAASPIFLLTKWFSYLNKNPIITSNSWDHRFQSSSLSQVSEFEEHVHNFIGPKESPMSYFANESLIQRQARRPINTKSREYLFSKNLVLIKNVHQFLQNIGIFAKV